MTKSVRKREVPVLTDPPIYSRGGRHLTIGQIKSRANLKPKKPGEAPARPGRPKGKTPSEWMRELLNGPLQELYDEAQLKGLPATMSRRVVSLPLGRALAEIFIKEALARNPTFAHIVLDRIEGTVAQRFAGPHGEPLPGSLSGDTLARMMGDPKLQAKVAELNDMLCPPEPLEEGAETAPPAEPPK
jgi:hypothetical protein